MFLRSFSWSVCGLSRRCISQTCILPYELDRFNAAQVRSGTWPDDVELVRQQLSS